MNNSIRFLSLLLLLIAGSGSLANADTIRRPGLVKPRKDLFSHANHTKYFDTMGIQCTDCHKFTIKQKEPGPTAPPITQKFLKPVAGVCHQCHLGKVSVSVPLRKQCLLCHADLELIKPADHAVSWRTRHGKLSQMDHDACTQCHLPQDCTGCHEKQNTMYPIVHRPNFRLSHSIQARTDPQSCVFCHKSAGFCMDCHSGRKK